MRKLPLPLLAVLVCSCVFPAFAQSASPQSAATLEGVSATGSKRWTRDQIAAVSGLHVGQQVTKDDFQATADRLAQLGTFSDVRYRFSSDQNGVTLELQVADAPALPVSFDNFPWFTDQELDQALRKDVILYDGTAPQSGTIVNAMAQSLEKLLATRAIQGTIEQSVVSMPGSDQPGNDRKVQQFRVAGPALKVEGVDFADALAKTDRKIQERLSDLIGKPYSRSAVELFDFEQVRPVYLAHSFLRVKFGHPMARFAGDPNRPLANTVRVIVPIEPGPAYTWAGAQWNGNVAVSGADLDPIAEQVGLKAGEPADGMKIAALWDKLSDAFGHLGYLEAKFDPVPEYDDQAGRVSYRVSVTEGPQYHMGNLVLTGVSLEGERRLRAAWRIERGALFDRTYYDEFVAKGVKVAFGDLPFHYEKLGRFLQTDAQAGTVDVLLDFQ
jgi:outer membrane protein assembly factor BamA